MTAQTLAAAFAPATPDRSPEQRGHGASISLRSLSKSFGPKKVLKSIDLFVPAGQFLAVVGRSGCGKSTLLRTVIGVEKPTSGAVMVAGGKTGLGRLMFQEPRLLPWARVVDNVAVGVRDRSDKKAARHKALEALEEVGLADRAGEWPSVLSGGQKQRVALARALVSHPQLLALDEPLGALDALTRIDMQALIERVWREQRFTAVLVTHDVAEALALADRVLLIEDGEIALDLNVDLPRPRRRGSPELARLEGAILDRLFGNEGARADEPVETAKHREAVA